MTNDEIKLRITDEEPEDIFTFDEIAYEKINHTRKRDVLDQLLKWIVQEIAKLDIKDEIEYDKKVHDRAKGKNIWG